MILIFCLDDRNGMMFNGRRQSQDRILRERILKITAESKLYMSHYSSGQFPDTPNIKVSDNCAKKADKGEYCFVEDRPFSLDDAEEIIIYRWNRHYPSDLRFEEDPSEKGFRLYETNEFEGSSHDKITEEKYRK